LGRASKGRRKKMRRAATMLGMVMLLVALAAGVAMAEKNFENIIQCRGDVSCSGSNQDDLMYERPDNSANDTIYGLRGADTIAANAFTRDRDRVFGGDGSDRLLVDDGDPRDTVRGGPGFDVCYVDPGDTVRGCESVRES
jgi:hypothetical protein